MDKNPQRDADKKLEQIAVESLVVDSGITAEEMMKSIAAIKKQRLVQETFSYLPQRFIGAEDESITYPLNLPGQEGRIELAVDYVGEKEIYRFFLGVQREEINSVVHLFSLDSLGNFFEERLIKPKS